MITSFSFFRFQTNRKTKPQMFMKFYDKALMKYEITYVVSMLFFTFFLIYFFFVLELQIIFVYSILIKQMRFKARKLN